MDSNQTLDHHNHDIVTVGDWIVTFILLGIPVVNIILMCLWAFGDSAPLSKKNFALASLIVTAVSIAIGIVFALLGGLTLWGIGNSLQDF